MNIKTYLIGNYTIDGLLFIIFFILKLCEIVNWSWWFVTAPLWIPIIMFILFLFIIKIILK